MARIMFTWELGGGLGHLVSYHDLIGRLREYGHEVWFISRNAEKASEIYGSRGVHVDASPYDKTPPEQRIRPPDSYSQILFNCGFHDPDAIKARIGIWRGIIERIRPDVLIADYSPSALLANRIFDIPSIITGLGFFLPPQQVPIPPYRYWQPTDTAVLERDERRVVDNMNTALRSFDARPVASVADAHLTDDQFLRTFPEFDLYRERGSVDYLGTFPRTGFGVEPVWPSGDGPRVFAYLRPSKKTCLALAALKRIDARVCLYGPGLKDTEIAAHAPQSIHVSAEPVDFAAAVEQCDAVVSYGNGNTLAQTALLGKPQLALPFTLETYLNARRLELLGAGLASVRPNPDEIAAKLTAVVSRREYRRRAEQFAVKYANGSESRQTRRMLQRITQLLAR